MKFHKLDLLAALIFVRTASASTNLLVSSDADAGPGSLRQAILDANSLGGATVTFCSLSNTIFLQESLPLFTANMSILGPGADQLAVTSVAGSVFTNATGNTVYVSGLRLTGVDFGGLRNFGTLLLNEVIVADGRSPSEGAGIFNSGTLYLNNSTISGNDSHGASGGGIFNSGTMTLDNCLVITNANGGIFNDSGTLTMDNCTIAGNHPSGPGGAGGIGNRGGTVIVRNCSVTNNIAVSGGGIWNAMGWLTVLNSTVAGNRARYSDPVPGGGIYNNGTAVIVNTTISGNNVLGTGGGVQNEGTLELLNSTIASNVVSAGRQGGGIWNAGSVTAQNSILAGNMALEGPDFFGTLYSDGFNLIQNTNNCTIVGVTTGNITGKDPGLAPLQNNGGPTWTHALLSGSPAIDSGTSYDAPSADERGVPRPQGLGVDIGAFEFQRTVPVFVKIHSFTNVSLQVWALPGATYALEASANLSQWLNVTNFTPGPNGLRDLVDDEVANHPIRFFRVKEIAP